MAAYSSIWQCKRCGSTERYAGGGCKVCQRNRVAAYVAANAEKVKARTKKYKESNPERVKAVKARWVAANSEKVKTWNTRWNEEHPEAVKAIRDRSYAKVKAKRKGT